MLRTTKRVISVIKPPDSSIRYFHYPLIKSYDPYSVASDGIIEYDVNKIKNYCDKLTLAQLKDLEKLNTMLMNNITDNKIKNEKHLLGSVLFGSIGCGIAFLSIIEMMPMLMLPASLCMLISGRYWSEAFLDNDELLERYKIIGEELKKLIDDKNRS